MRALADTVRSVPSGVTSARGPDLQPRHCLHLRGARTARPRRALAAGRRDPGPAVRPGLRGLPAQGRRPGAAHLPPGAPGHERDALLRRAPAPPHRDGPGGLHPGRRPGLLAVLADLPPPPRPLPQLPDAGPARAPAREPSTPRGGRGGGDRWRAGARDRRSGCRRDGHLHRQAPALHALRRGRAVAHPPRPARRGDQQRRPARRAGLHRLATRTGEGARPTSTSWTRSCARCGGCSPACCSSGRTSRAPTPPPCWSVTGTRSAPSTTTSRARRRWWWRCSPGPSASPNRASGTSASSSPARAARGLAWPRTSSRRCGRRGCRTRKRAAGSCSWTATGCSTTGWRP